MAINSRLNFAKNKFPKYKTYFDYLCFLPATLLGLVVGNLVFKGLRFDNTFSQNDSWAYSKIASHFYETYQIDFSYGPVKAFTMGLPLLSFPFAKNALSQAMFSILCGLLILWLVNKQLKDNSIKPRIRALVITMISTSPIFILGSTSYMLDIPSLLLILVALFFCYPVSSKLESVSLARYFLGLCLIVFSFTLREQNLIILFSFLFFEVFLKHGSKQLKKFSKRRAVALLVSITLCLILEIWRRTFSNTIAATSQDLTLGWAKISLQNLANNCLMIGLVLFPLMFKLFISRLSKHKDLLKQLILIFVASFFFRNFTDFPGNYFSPYGAYPDAYANFPESSIFVESIPGGMLIWDCLRLIGALGFILFLVNSKYFFRNFTKIQKLFFISGFFYILGLFMLALYGNVSPDNLLLSPIVLFILAFSHSEINSSFLFQPKLGSFFLILSLFITMFANSTIAIYTVERDTTIWKLANASLISGSKVSEIDAGFDWNGVKNLPNTYLRKSGSPGIPMWYQSFNKNTFPCYVFSPSPYYRDFDSVSLDFLWINSRVYMSTNPKCLVPL
jgi:hypothetical protein